MTWQTQWRNTEDKLPDMNSFVTRAIQKALGGCLTVLALLHAPAGAAAQPAPHIAAAADLQFALPALLGAFKRQTGSELQATFGSSGNLARQIAAGAPFEIFLSADVMTVRQLAAAGRTEGEGRHYATGRLVLFLPKGSPIRADRDLDDFAAALRDGRLQRLAIANPQHAPYGRAAQEVLTHQNLWARAHDKLALGDNAAQAAQFAASGAAQAGLIPLSLAIVPELRDKGAFVTLPAHWHTPILQTLAIIKGASPAARAFADFLHSEEAGKLLSANGFALPPPISAK